MARTRAHDYENKRLRIARSSAKLFAQFGFSGTSITMIADACGMSKALLYHYYSDKDAVLFDVIYFHLEHLVEVTERVSQISSNPKELLLALSIALLESYRGADAEHQVQISSLKLLPEYKQDLLRTMERKLVSVFSEALAAAVPEVANGPLLKPLTMSLFGMLNWHYLWFREGKGLSRDDYALLAVNLVTAGAGQAVVAVTPPVAVPAQTSLVRSPRVPAMVRAPEETPPGRSARAAVRPNGPGKPGG